MLTQYVSIITPDEPRAERLYQIEHPRMVSLFDDICPVTEDQRGYWISKHWLKGLKTYVID
jgi:hypothetical protein